jgi:hypothetical protein
MDYGLVDTLLPEGSPLQHDNVKKPTLDFDDTSAVEEDQPGQEDEFKFVPLKGNTPEDEVRYLPLKEVIDRPLQEDLKNDMKQVPLVADYEALSEEAQDRSMQMLENQLPLQEDLLTFQDDARFLEGNNGAFQEASLADDKLSVSDYDLSVPEGEVSMPGEYLSMPENFGTYGDEDNLLEGGEPLSEDLSMPEQEISTPEDDLLMPGEDLSMTEDFRAVGDEATSLENLFEELSMAHANLLENNEPLSEELSIPEEELSMAEDKLSMPGEDISMTEDYKMLQDDEPISEELSMPEEELSMPEEELSMPEDELSMPEEELSMPEEELSMPEDELAMPGEDLSMPEDFGVVGSPEQNDPTMAEEFHAVVDEQLPLANDGDEEMEMDGFFDHSDQPNTEQNIEDIIESTNELTPLQTLQESGLVEENEDRLPEDFLNSKHSGEVDEMQAEFLKILLELINRKPSNHTAVSAWMEPLVLEFNKFVESKINKIGNVGSKWLKHFENELNFLNSGPLRLSPISLNNFGNTLRSYFTGYMNPSLGNVGRIYFEPGLISMSTALEQATKLMAVKSPMFKPFIMKQIQRANQIRLQTERFKPYLKNCANHPVEKV